MKYYLFFNQIYLILFYVSSIIFFVSYFKNKLYDRNYLFNYFFISIITTTILEYNCIASFFHFQNYNFYKFSVTLAIWPILNLKLKPIYNVSFLFMLTMISQVIIKSIEIQPIFLSINILVYLVLVLIKRKKDIYFITENISLLIIFIFNNFFFVYKKHPDLWQVHTAFSSFVRPLWLSLMCFFYLTIIFRYGKFKHLH